MDDKLLIQFQQQQIRTLLEEKAAALEAFDLARELGSFMALSRQQPTRRELLQEICLRANRMIPFKSCAIYLVDDDSQDFVQSFCHPKEAEKVIEKEVEDLIADHSFSYALQSEGPVFFLDSTRKTHLLLHTLSTPFRIRGMFIGQMFQNKEEILDTTLKLFSVIMLSAVNALENMETHAFMRNHSQELEQKVQKRTQELADAYERMNVTLNGMQAGVLVIDAETHRIVDANPKALQLLGTSWKELSKLECFEVICSSKRGSCPITDLGKEEDNGEYVITRGDGKKIPIQKTVSKVMIGDRLHLVENFIDITEQKKLADLKEDVERIMRHDLKSPLNGIIGLPEMLLDDRDSLTEEQREILEHIRASGYKLLNMINLSLDLYKMETGSYRYTPGVADIFTILRSALKDLSDLIRWKKIPIKTMFAKNEVADDFSLPVCCDEFLTYSLLSNLLKNAVEASPAKEPITIDVSRHAGILLISIHNMGIIPEDIRDTFFDKYVTADKSGGTGLGTYSARLITETMGGEISYSSTEMEGTSILIKLPDDS